MAFRAALRCHQPPGPACRMEKKAENIDFMKRFVTIPPLSGGGRRPPAPAARRREASHTVLVAMIADLRPPAACPIHPGGMKDGSRGLSAAIPPVHGRKRPHPGRVP